MNNDRLITLAILLGATAGVVGIFFSVPKYVPAIIIVLAFIPAMMATKD